MERARSIAAELLAAAAGPVALLIGLRGVLPTLGAGLWGPADPWLNGDFSGGWWLWWAFASGGDAFAGVSWPRGIGTVAGVIPNPLDMWALAALLGPPTVAAWNGVQLTWALLNLLSAYALTRALGAGRAASAVAGALLAASPVLLHEVAGGRPSSLVIWPGLSALALLVGGRRWQAGVAAGLLAALQGEAYAWHGFVLILAGLPLVRWDRAGLKVAAAAAIAGALAIAPYLLWLADGLAAVPTDRPPAGYTALPLAGLLGLDIVPSRYRAHLLLLPLALAAAAGAAIGGRRGAARRAAGSSDAQGSAAGAAPSTRGAVPGPSTALRALAGAVIALGIALGPSISWDLGEPIAAGPWAWVSWAWEGARRMHHPVRATLIGLPLLAAAGALGLEGLRRALPRPAWWVIIAGLLGSSALSWKGMDEATTYAQPPAPPFAEVAIPGEGPVVDLLGMRGRTALSLQTVHGHPVAEPLWFRRAGGGIEGQLDALSRGQAAPPSLWGQLRDQGFTYLLVFDRFGDAPPAAEAQVREALGEPVAPGIYPLAGAR